MRNVVVTINLNEFLCDNVRSSFQHAAERWGARYLELDEQQVNGEQDPLRIKLKIFDYCRAQRIFYIDADAVIRNDTPSPFDITPTESLGVVKNSWRRLPAYVDLIRTEVHDWTLLDKLYKNFTHFADYFNAGVLVLNRDVHQQLMLKALSAYDRFKEHDIRWHEQSILNYCVARAHTELEWLDESWNYTSPCTTHIAQGMTQYVYHFAGDSSRNKYLSTVDWAGILPASNSDGSNHLEDQVHLVRYKNFLTRPGTLDANIFDEVTIRNEYKIPHDLTDIDLVIDIGGHIGSFSKMATRRGAKKVISIEPNAENHLIAKHNLKQELREGSVDLINAALWGGDSLDDLLAIDNLPAISSDCINTGGASLVTTKFKINSVKLLSMDNIIYTHEKSNDVLGKVLVKLDCEGAEWPILYTSKRLADVALLCGELHPTSDRTYSHKNGSSPHRDKPEDLQHFLEGLGFSFKFTSHTSNNQTFGLFWAVNQKLSS